MKNKKIFGIIGGVMTAVAIVFFAYVITHPEFGTVFYIGGFEIGSLVWKVFYLLYAAVTVGMFAAFLLVGKRN